jgi:hypothetical protein
MMTMSVSTDRVSRVEEDAKYLELVICFYPGGDTPEDENLPSKSDAKVLMPQSWTPKMYLAAHPKQFYKKALRSILRIDYY